MRAFIAVAIVSLIAAANTHAGEVTAETTLPPSGEPARMYDPPCGNPDGITKADVVLQGLSAAADTYIGFPVVSSALESLPAPVKNWLKVRIGIHDGPSVCSTLCVVTPSGIDAEGDASFCLYEPDGLFTCRPTVASAYNTLNYALFTDLSVAKQGAAQVVCVGVKNWAHDTQRRMTMTIRYEDPLDLDFLFKE